MGSYGVAATSLVMGSKIIIERNPRSPKPCHELVYNAAEDE